MKRRKFIHSGLAATAIPVGCTASNKLTKPTEEPTENCTNGENTSLSGEEIRKCLLII